MPDDEPKPKAGIGSEKPRQDKISTSNHAPGPQPLDILKTYQEISQHAREAITWIKSAYKLAGWLVAIVFAFGVAFTYKSSSDFRNETRQETERLTAQIHDKLSASEADMKIKIEAQMVDLSQTVQRRVEKEFEVDGIKRLVESKAKERIDLIADKFIQEAVSNRVEHVRSEMISMIKTNIDEIKGLLKQANETLAQVRQQSEFILTVLAAQGDDRKAYDQLGIWAGDSSFPLHAQAEQSRYSIQQSYAGMFNKYKSYKPITIRGGDLGKMTFSEITNLWQSTPSDGASAYIYLVLDLTNITQNQKHFFLYDILSDSRNSLQAADLAATILEKESNIPYNAPLNFDLFKNLFKDWMISNTVPCNATNQPVAPVVSPKK